MADIPRSPGVGSLTLAGVAPTILANYFTLSRTKIVGQINQVGASGAITVTGSKLVDISIDFDTDAFVGTIDLQRETNTGASNVAEWQTVESYSASSERLARSASTTRYRLNCTTATSGSAQIELAAGNRA